jgi:succinate dehydrogenase flavin-adding protein (antitoxin of CptAB toxin-antitoxin module)
MLELDLMLQRFLDRYLASLNADEMTRFKELLELQDGDLWDVLSGRAEIGDCRLEPIVQMIKGTSGGRVATHQAEDPRL